MSVSFSFLQSPQETFLLGHLCFLPSEIEMMEKIVEKSRNGQQAFQFVWELGFEVAARYAPHIASTPVMRQGFVNRNPENAFVRFYLNPIQLSYRLRAIKYVAGIIYWQRNLPDIPMPLYNRIIGLTQKTAASWLLEEEIRKNHHPNAMAALFVFLSRTVSTRRFPDLFMCSGQMMSVDDNRAGPKTRRLLPYYNEMVSTYFAIKEYALHISSTYSSRMHHRNDMAIFKKAAVKIKISELHLHFMAWLADSGVGGGIVSDFIENKQTHMNLLAHEYLRVYLLYHCECSTEDANMPYLSLSPLQALNENDDAPPVLEQFTKRFVPAAFKYGYLANEEEEEEEATIKRQRVMPPATNE